MRRKHKCPVAVVTVRATTQQRQQQQILFHGKHGQKQVDLRSNVRSRCGPRNAHFISIRRVSLPVDFPVFAATD